MTPEERQMLADLFDRVRAAGAAARDSQAEASSATPCARFPMRLTCSLRPC